MIFPFYKRATAIGICNFIARTITITSSLVAELPRPWPGYIFLTITFISFLNAFFLPSKKEEEDYDEMIKNFENKNEK